MNVIRRRWLAGGGVRRGIARVATATLLSAFSASTARAQPEAQPVVQPVHSVLVQLAAQPVERLTLREALRLAAQQSPLLQRVEAQSSMARGENRTAGQWPNPVLEYRRENLGAPLDPDEFFTAYIPIDVTGRRVQLARATRRGAARVAAVSAAARRDAELQIAQRWVDAVLANDLGVTARAQHAAVVEIARRQAERAREGVVSEASALRTRVEADRLAHAAALAETRAVAARHALAAVLGMSADSLPALPGVLDPEGVPITNSMEPGASLQDSVLLRQARLGREELRAAEAAREEASLRRRVEGGAVIGDWQLQGGSKRTGGFMSGQVGLAVPVPLFNRNGGARERADGAVREADAAWRIAMLAVTGEVLAAADRVRRLRELGTRFAASPDDGEVIAASARIAYAEGHMSLLELLDAERASADARATAQQYRADLYLAQLTLARAIGAPLMFGDQP